MELELWVVVTCPIWVLGSKLSLCKSNKLFKLLSHLSGLGRGALYFTGAKGLSDAMYLNEGGCVTVNLLFLVSDISHRELHLRMSPTNHCTEDVPPWEGKLRHQLSLQQEGRKLVSLLILTVVQMAVKSEVQCYAWLSLILSSEATELKVLSEARS